MIGTETVFCSRASRKPYWSKSNPVQLYLELTRLHQSLDDKTEISSMKNQKWYIGKLFNQALRKIAVDMQKGSDRGKKLQRLASLLSYVSEGRAI